MGAKQFLQAGETCQNRLNNLSRASEFFEKALQLFEAESQPAAAGKAKEKLALLNMEMVCISNWSIYWGRYASSLLKSYRPLYNNKQINEQTIFLNVHPTLFRNVEVNLT